jgi:murein DD-endopeptidase MepM/ murein hydrolase activator NlpD
MSSDANPALGSKSFSQTTEFSAAHNKDSLSTSSIKLTKSGQTPVVSASTVALPPNFSVTPANDIRLNREQQPTVGDFVHGIQQQLKHTLADQVTPVRLAGHLSVLVVAAIILVLSQMKLPEWNISLNTLPNSALGNLDSATQPQTAKLGATSNGDGSLSGSLQRSAVPFTVAPKAPEQPRQAIEVYTVKAGDSVLAIAAKYGLQPETIMWANTDLEQNPDRLQIGQQVNVLPVNGVLHIVKPGDTLSSLAAKYKVELNQIVGYKPNGLADASSQLKVGSQLVIPGGAKPFVQQQLTASYTGPVDQLGSGNFSWPTSGSITQGYWGGHPAVDIGSWIGAPAKAADSGVVVEAGGGWSSGYGNHVIIDHGNGFTTLYAHLTSIFVKPGESVTRGEQIGTVGSTGNSTGPHLHFEIRYQGVPRNPFNWLP